MDVYIRRNQYSGRIDATPYFYLLQRIPFFACGDTYGWKKIYIHERTLMRNSLEKKSTKTTELERFLHAACQEIERFDREIFFFFLYLTKTFENVHFCEKKRKRFYCNCWNRWYWKSFMCVIWVLFWTNKSRYHYVKHHTEVTCNMHVITNIIKNTNLNSLHCYNQRAAACRFHDVNF